MSHRDAALSPTPGLALALAIHVVAFALMVQFSPVGRPAAACGNAVIEMPEQCDDGNREDHDGCSARCTLELELREIELVKPPEPEPPPPEPEPEPELPPPEPEVKPPPPPPRDTPKPKPKPKDVQPESLPPPPAAAPPPPAIELPMDTTIGASNSGVTVIGGTQSRAGERGGQREGKVGGRPEGKGTTPGGPTAEGQGASLDWSPVSDLYVATLPAPVRVNKIQCPAATELELSGTVKLKVQIRRDGSIRGVRVVSDDVGHGCHKVAVKALREAKFKPAVGTNGKSTDYELTYEYAFKPAG